MNIKNIELSPEISNAISELATYFETKTENIVVEILEGWHDQIRNKKRWIKEIRNLKNKK